MPSNNVKWSDIGKITGEEFVKGISTIVTMTKALEAQLLKLGARASKYWQLSIAGDPKATVAFDSVRRQAALIVTRYLRKADREMADTIIGIIAGVLDIVLAVLSKVLL